jgi:hypothetical protein
MTRLVRAALVEVWKVHLFTSSPALLILFALNEPTYPGNALAMAMAMAMA